MQTSPVVDRGVQVCQVQVIAVGGFADFRQLALRPGNAFFIADGHRGDGRVLHTNGHITADIGVAERFCLSADCDGCGRRDGITAADAVRIAERQD